MVYTTHVCEIGDGLLLVYLHYAILRHPMGPPYPKASLISFLWNQGAVEFFDDP